MKNINPCPFGIGHRAGTEQSGLPKQVAMVMTGEPDAEEAIGQKTAQYQGPARPHQPSASGTPSAFPGSKLLGQIAEFPFMVALRRGLLMSLPLVMVGAFANFVTALLSFPALAARAGAYETILREVCTNIINGTFGMTALVVLLGFSYSLGTISSSETGRNPVPPATVSAVALSSFIIIVAPESLADWQASFSSARGLPAALLVAISASYLFLFLGRRSIFRIRMRGFGDDPIVGDIVSILPAAAITILTFAVIRELQLLVGAPKLATALSALVAAPFSGGPMSAASTAAFAMIGQVIWFFGAHGANLMSAVRDDVLIQASQANFDAVARGIEPVEIVTRQFFTLFTGLGGSGGTICLIFALLIGDREPPVRRLALLSLLPALINVNEPLLFGLPLILNPVYAIPFILTPVVQALIGYQAIALGFVPAIGHPVPWTLPPLINGWVGTGSLSGSAAQLLAIAVGTGIYLPFVHISARLRVDANRRALHKLLAASEASELGFGAPRLLELPGHAGRLATALALDLGEVLSNGSSLYLEYQPQIFICERRVFGVEALLRWDHPIYGAIPPPVIVALAEDTNTINRLGEQVLRLACRQRVTWGKVVPADLLLSVNVSPRQLTDPDFDLRVLEILAEEGLAPHLLELEITESTALLPAVQSIPALHRLRTAGVRLALDDFGMGHTSLHYLRELPLNTLKIDRSLTFTSQGDLNEHVIRSIVSLSKTLGIVAVVEGIEQPEQLPRFIDLGCDRFQGYLFSRPLKSGPCLDYIQSNVGV